MHGSALVTTNEIICFAVDPDDPVVDHLDAWVLDRGLAFQILTFGDSLTYAPEETLGVAVGGDGTFLEAVRAFSPHDIPIAGVNRGTLSFLSRIQPAEITDALAEILRGEAAIVNRQQYRIDGPGLDAIGINDVTLEPPDATEKFSCRVDAFVDDEYVGAYQGGGLVVAPSTGSTAMGLSAGGPILHPRDTGTFELIPLHDDRIGAHPLVLDADREISLVPRTPVRVLVDGGRSVARLSADDTVRVTGAGPAHLVRTSFEQSFMAALATKLGWALRSGEAPSIPEPDGEGSTAPDTRGQTDATDGASTGDGRSREATGQGQRWSGDPTGIWQELQSESPPRVGTWTDRSTWPERDERPDWLRERDTGAVPPAADLLEAARRTACEAAVAAGQLAHRHFRRLGPGSTAADSDVLAAAETGSQRILAAIIENAFPEHAILAEDENSQFKKREYTWLLDPIDGVSNFQHGNPSYCTTVALLREGSPVVGVVYAPAPQELFHAVASREAVRNDVLIRPTDRDSLAESMLLSGYDPDGEFLQKFYEHTRGVRRLGSQALNLAYVAAGSADALWEYDTTPWDAAAGICLLRAAGGRVTDPAGEPYEIWPTEDERQPLLASNGPLHPAVVDLLANAD